MNPAVSSLNGAKVGELSRVTMHDVRNMETCVPPCANADRVTFDLEVLELLS